MAERKTNTEKKLPADPQPQPAKSPPIERPVRAPQKKFI